MENVPTCQHPLKKQQEFGPIESQKYYCQCFDQYRNLYRPELIRYKMVNDLPVLNIESELPEDNQEDTTQIDKILAEAQELMKKGRYDQAIVELYKIEF